MLGQSKRSERQKGQHVTVSSPPGVIKVLSVVLARLTGGAGSAAAVLSASW